MDFSKEKDGIFKKAHKINVLCGAEVSIIMLCGNNELYEYTTPTTSMKKIIDQYQSEVGVDLWSSHYEQMQEELRRLKDVNTTIKREIMQRKGEELDNLNMEQLCTLEEEMLSSLQILRDRKYRVFVFQIECRKKKVKILQDSLLDLEMELDYCGTVVDEGGHGSTSAYDNLVPVHQPRIARRDGDEDSCITTMSMEVEDSD